MHLRDKVLSSSEKFSYSDELSDMSDNWCDVRLDRNCGECNFLLEDRLCSLTFKDFSSLLTVSVRAVMAFCCCKHICCVFRSCCCRKPEVSLGLLDSSHEKSWELRGALDGESCTNTNDCPVCSALLFCNRKVFLAFKGLSAEGTPGATGFKPWKGPSTSWSTMTFYVSSKDVLSSMASLSRWKSRPDCPQNSLLEKLDEVFNIPSNNLYSSY